MSNDSQISTIDDQPSAATVKATKASKAALSQDAETGEKRRTITIHASDADGGNEAVFVSVNGVAWQIPRGKPEKVPEEVIHALELATVTTYKSGNDGKVKEQSTPRFAFSVSA